MMKWLLGLLIIFLLFIGLVVAALLTPTGLKIGMHLVEKSLPGTLKYKTISGLIIGPITATEVTYRYQHTTISIKKLYIQWRPSELLAKKLSISQLKAEHINIIIPEKKRSATAFTLPSIKLPMALSIDNATLNDINIGHHPDHYTTQLRSLIFSANIGASHNEESPLNANVAANLTQPYSITAFLRLSGTLDNYRFTLITQSKQIHWTMNGMGGSNWIQATTHQAHTLGGQLNGNVKIISSPEWQWKVNIDAHRLNLKDINPAWPKQFSIKLISQGTWHDKNPVFTLNSRVQTPGTLIQIKGKHDQHWDLAWNIDTTQLATLLTKANGTLHGHGKIMGPTHTPTISGQLKGQKISVQDYSIGEVNGQWNVDSSYQHTSHIKLTAKNIKADHLHIAQLQLNANGQPDSHRISALMTLDSANSGSTQINLLLNGQLIDHLWRGQLKRFDIQSELLGRWRLRNTAQISATSQKITTTPLCWHAKQGHACLKGQWSATAPWQATLTGKGINLTPLLTPFKKELALHTPATIAINVNGNGKKLTQAKASVQFGKGNIHHATDKDILRIKFTSGAVQATLGPQGLTANLRLNLSSVNTINANVNLPHFTLFKKWTAKQPLDGTLKINTNNLKLIRTLSPDISNPTGRLVANLNMAGTLAHPTLSGHIELQNGSAQITPLRVTLSHITIDLRAMGSTITYNIQATSQKNRFQLIGQTQLDLPGRPTHLTLQGDDVLVMNTSEYTVYATPDLKIDIIAVPMLV